MSWIPALAGAVVLMTLCLYRSIRTCPANRLLIVRDRWRVTVDDEARTQVHTGGVHFVWPFLQEWALLDLSPMTVEVDLTECTGGHIRRPRSCSFRTCFNQSTAEGSSRVSRRYGWMSREEVRSEVHSIVSAVVREALSTWDRTRVNEDRNAFVVDLRKRVHRELSEEGFQLLTVSLR